MAKLDMNYLWADRKRILGMPISFTKYAMNGDRLFREQGLLNTVQEEVLLYRVRDISLYITLWQRIFGVGTVCIQSADQSTPVLELKNIKQPREVKELVHQYVEKIKADKNVRVNEFFDTSSDDEEMHFH